MTAVTNKQRAAWATAVIERYNELKEGRTAPYDTIENAVTDLLCDLMHYAKRIELDIEATFARAKSRYEDDEMERYMDLVHELPDFIAVMKKARSELQFQQAHFPRSDDTELRETLHALDRSIARAEGGAP